MQTDSFDVDDLVFDTKSTPTVIFDPPHPEFQSDEIGETDSLSNESIDAAFREHMMQSLDDNGHFTEDAVEMKRRLFSALPPPILKMQRMIRAVAEIQRHLMENVLECSKCLRDLDRSKVPALPTEEPDSVAETLLLEKFYTSIAGLVPMIQTRKKICHAWTLRYRRSVDRFVKYMLEDYLPLRREAQALEVDLCILYRKRNTALKKLEVMDDRPSEECGICTMRLFMPTTNEKTMLIRMVCGHSLCVLCLLKMLKLQPSSTDAEYPSLSVRCPYCRQLIIFPNPPINRHVGPSLMDPLNRQTFFGSLA